MEHAPAPNEYREQRLANLRALQEKGIEPFGGAFERTGNLAAIRAGFAAGAAARAAGRLVALRDMGKSVFGHLQDASGKFQVYFKKDALPEAAFAAVKHLDLGDHVGVEGELFTTRTGEPTIKVTAWTMLSKALLPLPEKWHGLHDVEIRYRQRYLDLIANPDVCRLFERRTAIVREIRAFLQGRGFQEVETPMMQPLAGGAAARPFETHYQALNATMYLRIAPELYLKRLLVGGLDKVYELNRNFRNEGLDRSHNPEFTMLEIYEAYGDLRTMKRLVEEMIRRVTQTVIGTLCVGTASQPVDLESPWREAAYDDLVREAAGADWFDLAPAAARERARGLGVEGDPAWSPLELTHEVYEKVVEKSLVNPTFVTRLPADLVPLAKRCADDPSKVDVFELVIAGKEIAPAYSELNDPIEQRRRFEAQAGGEGGKVDEDFLAAMDHGMPPAGGMGIGIDRLVMILTGSEAIRDVIFFPQMKAK